MMMFNCNNSNNKTIGRQELSLSLLQLLVFSGSEHITLPENRTLFFVSKLYHCGRRST